MRFLLIALLCTLSLSTFAKSAWINDQILVPIRSGAGNHYRIVRNALKSGTSVDVLEKGDTWSKVRYKNSTGYIANQYLSNHPTAAIRLSALQAKYKRLKSRYASVKSDRDTATDKNQTLAKEVTSLKNQLAQQDASLKKVKAVAASPLKINKANKTLNKQLSLLQTKLDQVKANNSILKHDHTYKGWAFGIGTIIIGMLFGAWIKSRGQRSRSSWV